MPSSIPVFHSPLPCMVHIDHLLYPHIIDLIWSSFLLRDLPVARRVCRAWRSRAEVILAENIRHVSLDFRPRTAAGQHDRVGLSVRDTLDTPEAHALLSVLDFTEDSTPGTTPLQPLNEPWRPLFAAGKVEVVDLVGFPNFLPSYLPELFGSDTEENAGADWDPPAKPVVRWHNTHSSCQKRIAYTPLGPDTPVYFLDLRPGLPLPVIRVPNERQPRTFIVSIDCYADPTAPILNASPALDLAPRSVTKDGERRRNLSTVTVILNDKCNPESRDERTEDFDHGVLFNYVQTLYDLGDMFCVVGLDAFLDGAALQKFRNKLEKRLFDHYYKATGAGPNDDVDPDDPPAMVDFMTHEEFEGWRAIGAARYEMYNVR